MIRPRSVRSFLSIAALASVALLVYASLVPLHYRPLSWDDSWHAWRQTPWLSLDVFHRADWIANALVVLPAGLLAAAAVDWGHQSGWPLLLVSPLITFALTLVIIGIEMAQIWFPPRTISLNDIAAGFIGAALGPMLWAFVGPAVERGVHRFHSLPRIRDRLAWLGIAWLACLVILSILPLDLILSRVEWQEKLAAGRVQWNPFSGDANARGVLVDFSLAALSFAPIGFFCAVAAEPRRPRWILWLLPVALQLIQLPFFSKSFSTPAIVGGWLGGWSVYWLGNHLDRLATFARRPFFWATLWCLAYAFALADLLWDNERVLRTSDEIGKRFAGTWSWPLVKYYAKSEYGAYTNIFEKMAMFAAIGACCAGWSRSVASGRRQLVIWCSLLAVIVLAFAIELVQIWLPPLVPDMSDTLVYLAGYGLGYYALSLVLAPAAESAHFSHRDEYFPEDSLADLGPVLANPSLRYARQRVLWFLCGLALLAIVAYGSLVPFNYTPHDFKDAWNQLLSSRTGTVKLSSVDWGVNVMLLIPASFCFLAAAWQRNASIAGRIAWSVVVLCGCLAFSVLIELAQSWFPPRVPTIPDVAAQACGAAIGIIAWWICGPSLNRAFAEVHVDDTRQNRLGLMLLAYVVGLLFFSLAPLDLTLHPVELVNKFRAGKILLVPFSYPAATTWQAVYDAIADVLIFVPVGVFATTFLACRNNTDRSIAHSLLLGSAIVVGVEAMQLLVLSRYTDATDLITGSLGVAIGVTGYRFLHGSTSTHVRDSNLRNWWLALGLTLYAVILVAIFWFPFHFDASNTEAVRQRFSQFFTIPFCAPSKAAISRH